MVASRIYPTVKYAMGHGKACRRVVVGGAPIAFDRGVDRAVANAVKYVETTSASRGNLKTLRT
jgi:hypothetical protein